MTKPLIVTGVDGFVGRHLARLAAERGWDVIGIVRSTPVDTAASIDVHDILTADLRREWPSSAPTDAPVIHLAGLAAVGASFDRPQEYIEGNSAMVTNLCESRLAAGGGGRILGVSTGAVYANVLDDESPRGEEHPIDFTSPYVVSKVLVENQLAYYRRRGLDVVVARPFNHIGPGQGPGFLLPDLLARLHALPPRGTLETGNIDTRRDYTDVRDVARAYLRMISAPTLQNGVYNVASGRSRSGREILELVCRSLGVDVPEVRIDPSRTRATDPSVIVGDNTRIASELGWRPEIPLDQTVADAVAG